ncbi:hypothetical protein [Leptospira noguchii]|uniref:hypothetical protein n=1 Tax=Leptospira noguchii TaxID=28182 RepID=UPI0009E5A482|nr:hypothetical protein [Leptospira noguchii]
MLPAVATLGREPVHYEICELRRRPRCIEFIIRPNFLHEFTLNTFHNDLKTSALFFFGKNGS